MSIERNHLITLLQKLDTSNPSTPEFNEITKNFIAEINELLVNYSIPTPEALRRINIKYENNLNELAKLKLTELHFLIIEIEKTVLAEKEKLEKQLLNFQNEEAFYLDSLNLEKINNEKLAEIHLQLVQQIKLLEKRIAELKQVSEFLGQYKNTLLRKIDEIKLEMKKAIHELYSVDKELDPAKLNVSFPRTDTTSEINFSLDIANIFERLKTNVANVFSQLPPENLNLASLLRIEKEQFSEILRRDIIKQVNQSLPHLPREQRNKYIEERVSGNAFVEMRDFLYQQIQKAKAGKEHILDKFNDLYTEVTNTIHEVKKVDAMQAAVEVESNQLQKNLEDAKDQKNQIEQSGRIDNAAILANELQSGNNDFKSELNLDKLSANVREVSAAQISLSDNGFDSFLDDENLEQEQAKDYSPSRPGF